jgi:hypothetical protein
MNARMAALCLAVESSQVWLTPSPVSAICLVRGASLGGAGVPYVLQLFSAPKIGTEQLVPLLEA